MLLEYSDDAADKLDSYESTDRQLCDALYDVFDLIRADSREPFLRNHYLRPPGAYAVEVFVSARSTSDRYYIFWQEEEGGVAFIKAVETTRTRLF
jgi:hypothetical protein